MSLLARQEMEKSLEDIVDSSSLADVVSALVAICDAKQVHVTENWQDKELARDWQRASNALYTAQKKVEELSIPQ